MTLPSLQDLIDEWAGMDEHEKNVAITILLGQGDVIGREVGNYVNPGAGYWYQVLIATRLIHYTQFRRAVYWYSERYGYLHYDDAESYVLRQCENPADCLCFVLWATNKRGGGS